MAKVVFMGTPDFAVPALAALLAQHDVIGVVTQPDRPAGRRQQLQQSPVKQLALQHNIPVFQPEKLRDLEAQATLRQWPADVFVVTAFGQLLPPAVLDMPAHGCLNIHASLLPRWRGAAPIQASIRAGDTETGITIMQMDVGLDTGPILTQKTVPITAQETGQSLHDKLAQTGAELLLSTLPGYVSGQILPQPQDDAGMTYAPTLEKSEGHIDWTQSAADIDRQIRAFTPWPGTFTSWNGQPLKVLAAMTGQGQARPGEVLLHQGQLAIGTGDGLIYPMRLQLAGRSASAASDFLNGHPQLLGSLLGD